MMTAGAIIALALQAATPAAHVDRSAAKWGVEYAPNQCIINRAFGDGPKPAILAIDVDPQSDRGDIVLLMPEKAWRGTSGTAAVTLTPGVAKFPARWVGGATGHDMYAIKLSLADDQWKAVPTAETLLVDAGADRPIDVPIKGIGKAFAALDGREFVIPDDIKRAALPVLRHRVQLTPEVAISGQDVDEVLRSLVDTVPAPRQ